MYAPYFKTFCLRQPYLLDLDIDGAFLLAPQSKDINGFVCCEAISSRRREICARISISQAHIHLYENLILPCRFRRVDLVIDQIRYWFGDFWLAELNLILRMTSSRTNQKRSRDDVFTGQSKTSVLFLHGERLFTFNAMTSLFGGKNL